MNQIALGTLEGCTEAGCPIKIIKKPTDTAAGTSSSTTPTSTTAPSFSNQQPQLQQTAAAAAAAGGDSLATTLVQYQGFGSFHSDNIEDLVRLPDDKYRMPSSFPVWALTYPRDSEIRYLEAFTDVIEAQDGSSSSNSNAQADTLSNAGKAQLALGLPVRRVRDMSIAHEPAEQEERRERGGGGSNSNNNNNNNNIHRATPTPTSAATQSAGAVVAAATGAEKQQEVIFGDSVSRRHFYTDTDRWIFVNHGAFGGALRGGTLIKRRFEDLMELQPLHFVDRAVLPNIVYCVRRLAAFFKCRPQDLVPASNATLALNAAVSACIRHHTDVVAYLDLEYGSVWKMLREQWNWTRCTMHEILMYPHLLDSDVMSDDQKLTNLLESKLPPQLDVFVVDHITSNSAMLLPVFSHIIPMLRRRGVRYIVVDGAHGALQYHLDFSALREDQLPTFYAGNLHKWMCTPKSAGFMWVHPSMQARTHSPIITHGARAGMLSEFAWEGTKEYGAFLTVPSVLDFWERRCGVQRVRDYCTTLLLEADKLLCAGFGVNSVPRGAPFMRLVPLPTFFHRKIFSAKFVQDTLHLLYNVEVPVKDLEGSLYMRVSAFIYNKRADYEKLRDVIVLFRATFRTLFAQFVQKRKHQEHHASNGNGNFHSLSPTAKQQEPNNADHGDDDGEDEVVLLQALADLLAVTSQPAAIRAMAKPTPEQLRDASPLPFIRKVISAFDLLERIQAEAKAAAAAANEEEKKRVAALSSAASLTADGGDVSAKPVATAPAWSSSSDNPSSPVVSMSNPMLKNHGNCAEQSASRDGDLHTLPSDAALLLPLPKPHCESGVVLNDGTEGFGGSLRVETAASCGSGFRAAAAAVAAVGAGVDPLAMTPLRTDSRAAQLMAALVAKKPCPDSTTKGGCGVYGINTMKTTAFTDSSSDED